MKGTAAPTPEETGGRPARRPEVRIDVTSPPTWSTPGAAQPPAPAPSTSGVPTPALPAPARPTAAPSTPAVPAPTSPGATADSPLAVAERLLVSPGSISPAERRRLAADLPARLTASTGRGRVALLALAAALADDLTAAGRSAVRDITVGADGTDLAGAVAAQIAGLMVDGFPMPDTLIADLATLVGTPAAVGVIAQRDPNRRRALRLLIAAARA